MIWFDDLTHRLLKYVFSSLHLTIFTQLRNIVVIKHLSSLVRFSKHPCNYSKTACELRRARSRILSESCFKPTLDRLSPKIYIKSFYVCHACSCFSILSWFFIPNIFFLNYISLYLQYIRAIYANEIMNNEMIYSTIQFFLITISSFLLFPYE